MKRYRLENYKTPNGKLPFVHWISSIKDPVVKRKLAARLRRVEMGNFGDWKTIKGTPDLCELREHQSPGYRIYFAVFDDQVILLLAGSTKQDQARSIERAGAYLHDYKTRMR